MKKIISLKSLLIIIAIIIFFSVVVLLLIEYKTVIVNEVDIKKYGSIDIDRKQIDRINNGEIYSDGEQEYYEKTGQIRLDAEDYGTVFESEYHFIIKRIVPEIGYHVTAVIDYSELDEKEKIFFADSIESDIDEDIFIINDEKYSSPYVVSLLGFTYGYTDDEIKNIVQKVKFIIYMEDDDGKVTSIKKSIKKDRINFIDPFETDIELMEEDFEK